MEDGRTYRDELAAAHARIADLEEELSQRSPRASLAWLSQLRRERERLLERARRGGLSRADRTTLALFALLFCVGVPLFLHLAGVGLPLSVTVGAVLALTISITYALALHGRRAVWRDKLAALDLRIEDASHLLGIAGMAHSLPDESAHVRVDARQEVAEEALGEEPEPPSEARADLAK